MRERLTLFAAVALALPLVTVGCATKKYVNTKVDETRGTLDTRVAGVEGQVEDVHETLDQHETQMDDISATAQEALDRAIEAGKLAEGKFLFETVLTDDSVRFGFDQHSLSPEAASELASFADQVRNENADVYIEIQGHTDATGPEEYNIDLGEERAEAVRRHLSREEGVPLHRMAVISYGEAAPIADNGTRDGRAQNRRVSLVVLR